MDCGGMTPLWLHRARMKEALDISAVKEKRNSPVACPRSPLPKTGDGIGNLPQRQRGDRERQTLNPDLRHHSVSSASLWLIHLLPATQTKVELGTPMDCGSKLDATLGFYGWE
jgi:hypothetical protein